jgi:PPM family protein phosphatase
LEKRIPAPQEDTYDNAAGASGDSAAASAERKCDETMGTGQSGETAAGIAAAADGSDQPAPVIMPFFEAEATESQENAAESDDEERRRTIPLDPLPDEMLATLAVSSRPQLADELLPTVRAVQHCHIGLVRGRNEDSSYLFTTSTGGQEPLMPFGLFVVADGMGGHHAGHEASKNVSRLVAKYVLERIYLPLLQNSTNLPGLPQEPIQEVMLEAVQAANLAIHNPDPDKDSGTTLTAALILGRRLYIAHVGDSRAYVYDGDVLRQVTTDHSYVRRLQEAGQLTEEEAATHPQRNMLYMAVGQGDRLDIDTFTQSLPKRGRLLLCSDGLWGLVPEPVLKQHLAKDKPLQETADELVKMALIAGGHDNITVVLVDFAM